MNTRNDGIGSRERLVMELMLVNNWARSRAEAAIKELEDSGLLLLLPTGQVALNVHYLGGA